MLALAAVYLFTALLGFVTLGTGGLTPYTLDAGTSVLLFQGAAAAASTILFVVQPRGDGGDRTIVLQALGVGGSLTTVTANLEASDDGGATFQPYGASGTGIALVATGVGTSQKVLDVVAGKIYRVNVTTLVLNTATAAQVIGTLD
jgi:hypothetical protein